MHQGDNTHLTAPTTQPITHWLTDILSNKNNIISLLCSAQITILYMMSANDFFSHFYHANQTLPELKENWMEDDITAFSETWHTISFALLVAPASIALFIINLMSMPNRLHQLFSGEQTDSPNVTHSKTLVTLSVVSGIWKMIVSSGDLFLLLQSIFSGTDNTENFWASLSITLLMAPGDIMAQLYNFMGQQPIVDIQNPTLRNILAGYFAFGYAASSVGIYGHTVNNSLKKAKLTDDLLTEIKDVFSKVFINGLHLFFNLIFGHQTITQYYPRFQSMLCKPMDSQDENSQLLETGTNTFQYNTLNRFDLMGFGASCYKTYAIYLSQVVLSTLFIDFKTLTASKLAFLTLMAALQLVSTLLIQLTYYRLPADESLRAQSAPPETTGIRRFCQCHFFKSISNNNIDTTEHAIHDSSFSSDA